MTSHKPALLGAWLLLALSLPLAPARPARVGRALLRTVRTEEPKVDGVLLDWCLHFSSECGRPVAEYWCVEHSGGSGVVGFEKAAAPAPDRTTLPKDGGYCNSSSSQCEYFAWIECEMPAEEGVQKAEVEPMHVQAEGLVAASRHYPHPTFKGYALDWCKSFAVDCGQAAADHFCEAKGFDKAMAFEGPEAMPEADGIATVLPFQGSCCSTEFHNCDTFASITCAG